MPLIPAPVLAKANKILFIAHLAIGDFTYLQNLFKAFAEANPQLNIDLWIDEVRCTSDQSKWEGLKKYSLYDWTENCSFFHKVYRQTYSPELLQKSIHEAQQENYPIIVSLATLRPYQYAELARKIGPDSFIIGVKKKSRWFAPWDKASYAKLNAVFAPYPHLNRDYHISAVHADWFYQMSGLQVTQQQLFPFVDIPEQWETYAQHQLLQWGVTEEKLKNGHKLVFINAYAKTKKRCWPLAKVADLIVKMRALPAWQDSTFIVNAVPQELANATSVISAYALQNTHLFSAQDNFFQLPAILKRCRLIISVETAVMHLANAVHVPVIALMRQKNPEWVPIDSQNSIVITAKNRREWVDAINVEDIIKVL